MLTNDNLPALCYCLASTVVTSGLLLVIAFNPKIDPAAINIVGTIAASLAAGGAGAANNNRKSEQENKHYSSSVNLTNSNEDIK